MIHLYRWALTSSISDIEFVRSMHTSEMISLHSFMLLSCGHAQSDHDIFVGVKNVLYNVCAVHRCRSHHNVISISYASM